MAGDVAGGGGVPDGEELGGEGGGGAGEAAVVVAELDEEEDEEAGGGADEGDVEEVLDVAVPCGVEVGVGVGRRGGEEGVIGGGDRG